MKKIILLLFLFAFNSLISTSEIVEESKIQEKKRIYNAKRIEELEIEIKNISTKYKNLEMQMKEINDKYSPMKSESERINLTYNIDQIYSNATEFYSKAAVESKQYYENAFSLMMTLTTAIISIIAIAAGLISFKFSDEISKFKGTIQTKIKMLFRIMESKTRKIDAENKKLNNTISKEIEKLKNEYKEKYDELKGKITEVHKNGMGYKHDSRGNLVQYIDLKENKEFTGENTLPFAISFHNTLINYSIIGDHNLKVLEITQSDITIKGKTKTKCKIVLSEF